MKECSHLIGETGDGKLRCRDCDTEFILVSAGERDAFDWAIRQSQSIKGITMFQMVRIFHLWSAVTKNGGKRLSDKEVEKIWKPLKLKAQS